jgi:hypothetical protein
MRFEFLMAVMMKITAFLDVMSCSLVDKGQWFEGTCCYQQVSPKRRYLSTKLNASHPRRQQSSSIEGTRKVRSNRNAPELHSECVSSNLGWNTILPEGCGIFLSPFTQMPR